MKTLVLFFTLALVSVSANATVHTVNNQVGMAADFTTIQSAIDAALAGDTIYIQPSAIAYGNATLNKGLCLMGPGFRPGFTNLVSQLGQLVIAAGANNSIIKSLNMNNVFLSDWGYTNNVLVASCFIDGQNPISIGGWANATNYMFEGNFIRSQTNGINVGSAGTGWVFRNNVLSVFNGGGVVYYAANGMIFDHNVMISASAETSIFNGAAQSSNNAVFTNNIIVVENNTGGAVNNNTTNCTWENNMTYSINFVLPDLPGNNYNNTNPNFVNLPNEFNVIGFDYDFHLSATSPALTADSNGGQLGVYGGPSIYNSRGYDNGMPRMENFQLIQSSAPVGGTISIQVGAASSGTAAE